jgi:hypothetical protein
MVQKTNIHPKFELRFSHPLKKAVINQEVKKKDKH